MYNNPYNYYSYMNIPRGMSMDPYIQGNMVNAVRPRGGLFKGLSNIKWGDVLNNTQKTLNVINQAIPVYYQIKPIFSNVKSFGRLISAFNDDKTNDVSNRDSKIEKVETSKNAPTFFIN